MAEVDLIIEAISKGFDKAAADLKKVGTESEGAGKKSETAKDKFSSFGSTITNLVGAGALLGLANQAVRFGKEAIMAASNAAEMQSKFNIVFGDVGGKVTQQLQDFATATGASRFELMGMAATLGDTFKPMGYTADEAGKLSVQMVKLATDLSSFNNIPVAEALQRIQGGLIGNHENLLKFGVLINEASLKEELMRMGADNLTGAQLNQAKVQARLNILMAGTTDAQGDAVRTADGFANSSRALGSAIGDLQVVLGNALLPAATDTVHIFTDLVQQFTITANVITGQMTPAITQLAEANNKLAKETDTPTEALSKLSEAMGVATENQDIFFDSTASLTDQLKALPMAALTGTVMQASGAYDELQANGQKLLVQFGDFTGDSTRLNDSLVKLGNGAITVSDNYVYLNGKFIATTEELQALNKATIAATVSANEQALIAARLSVQQAAVAEQIPRVSDAEAELSDKRAQAANLLTEEEANLAAYHAEMVRGAQLDADADAAAQVAIQASKERAAAQAELTEQIRQNSLAMVEAAAKLSGEYFNAAVQATDQTFNFEQAMYDAAVAQGASATQLALLTTQSLGYTEAQTQALLADALRQAKTQELTQAYLDHKISLAEATESMRLFELEVNDLAAAQLTAAENSEAQAAANSPLTDGLNNAALAAENLANKLGDLPDSKTIDVTTNYTTNGTPPNIPGGAFGPDNNKIGQPGAPASGNAGASSFMLAGPPRTTAPARPSGDLMSVTIINQFPLNLGATAKDIAKQVSAILANDIRTRAGSGGTRGR